jgi:branched-chain amino acid transport system substrate-binding protein
MQQSIGVNRPAPRAPRMPQASARMTRVSTMLGLCAGAVVLAAGCRGTGGAGDAGATRLAIVFDDSFGQASLGGEAKRGAMLAVEEARGGGFHAMYFGDAGAAEAAREAVAAVGFTDSDELRAAMPAFAAAGTPLVVAGATDPCLLTVAGAHLLEFACYSDPMQGAAMAEFAHERLAVRQAVVLFDAKSEFANAVGSAFTTAMRGLPEGKSSVVAFSGDIGAGVAAVLAKSPQAVYVAALPQDGPRVIEALRAAGFAGPVLGPDSFDEPAIFAAANLGKVYYSTHAWLAGKGDPAVETFVASYRRRFGGEEPTAFAALGYDATRTAIAAIARAQAGGVVSRATVGRALRELGAQDGVSGTIDPSASEPFPRKSVWIVESSGGTRALASRWEPVRVPEPSCGKQR